MDTSFLSALRSVWGAIYAHAESVTPASKAAVKQLNLPSEFGGGQVILRRNGSEVALEASNNAYFCGVANKILLGTPRYHCWARTFTLLIRLSSGDGLHSQFASLLLPPVKREPPPSSEAGADDSVCYDESCQGCSLLHKLLQRTRLHHYSC